MKLNKLLSCIKSISLFNSIPKKIRLLSSINLLSFTSTPNSFNILSESKILECFLTEIKKTQKEIILEQKYDF